MNIIATEARELANAYNAAENQKLQEEAEKYAEDVGLTIRDAAVRGKLHVEVQRETVKSALIWARLVEIFRSAGYSVENSGNVLIVRW